MKIIRRFHLGARHAANTHGIQGNKIVQCLKKGGYATEDAKCFLKGFKFRVVRSLVKGLEVKTSYGLGTIVELRGIEGMAGFSLVVQLDSWVLADGQKPRLYCEADEVITVHETAGVLTSANKRRYRSSVEQCMAHAAAFLGSDNKIEVDEREEQVEDRNKRPKRSCRYKNSDKEGNVVIKEFDQALYSYLQDSNNSHTFKWLNFGHEFMIYREDLLASDVRTLMGMHLVVRERKKLRQWLSRELFDHGFIRTR